MVYHLASLRKNKWRARNKVERYRQKLTELRWNIIWFAHILYIDYPHATTVWATYKWTFEDMGRSYRDSYKEITPITICKWSANGPPTCVANMYSIFPPYDNTIWITYGRSGANHIQAYIIPIWLLRLLPIWVKYDIAIGVLLQQYWLYDAAYLGLRIAATRTAGCRIHWGLGLEIVGRFLLKTRSCWIRQSPWYPSNLVLNGFITKGL